MSCGCGCDGGRVHLRANLAGGVRRGTFRGKEHVIVPVVMLRQTVVNGAFVHKEQLKPEAWNGVPVTLNHPEERGQSITANHPTVLEEWQVGTIFNSKMKGDRLVAEAWVDVELAEALMPGLIAQLENGSPMDVSTGYFPTVKAQSGSYSGKSYTEVHVELKPDHLALLPNSVGACSWEDGCGVRANSKGKPAMPKTESDEAANGLMTLFARLGIVPNRRGPDNDRRQIAADLISHDSTPFIPDDMYSLMELSDETLQDLRTKYLPGPKKKEPKTNATEEGDTLVSDPKNVTPAANPAPVVNKVSDMTVEAFTALVTNTAKSAAATAVEEALSANKRAELVEKLVANKDLGLTAEELKDMPLSAMEKLVSNTVKKTEGDKSPKVNFSGRPLRTNADDGSAPPKKFAGMVSNGASAEAPAKKEA